MKEVDDRDWLQEGSHEVGIELQELNHWKKGQDYAYRRHLLPSHLQFNSTPIMYNVRMIYLLNMTTFILHSKFFFHCWLVYFAWLTFHNKIEKIIIWWMTSIVEQLKTYWMTYVTHREQENGCLQSSFPHLTRK